MKKNKFILYDNGNFLYYRSFIGGNPVIGKGNYGAVIKPDIKHHNDNYISKLFILPDRVNISEFTYLETELNRLDPKVMILDQEQYKYHVSMIDIETINSSHNLEELEYDDRERYTYIATYEYGGISLDNLLISTRYNSIITPEFCKQMLLGFLNIFEGIIYFAEKGIHHNDTHSGNIVMMLENPSNMRLIDFNINHEPFLRRYRADSYNTHEQPKISIDLCEFFSVIIETLRKFMSIFKKKEENILLYKYFESLREYIGKSRDILEEKLPPVNLEFMGVINDIMQNFKTQINDIDPFI